MSYTVEPIDVVNRPKERVIDPRSKKTAQVPTPFTWWLAQNEKDLCTQVLSTTEYLSRNAQTRIRQASVFTRLYCGKPLYNFLASTSTLDNSNQLPIGRPTANVSYSCTDTLVSRMSQDKPLPIFLTDNGHYKERRLSKQANAFIQGEMYRTKVNAKMPHMLRDACVLGTGFLKVGPKDEKVHVERTLETELLVDYNDAYYGYPRTLIQKRLVDRGVFLELYPDHEGMIHDAQHGNVDNTPRSTDTISDQFIIAEGWHLPSSPGAKDGRHVIVCSEGVILDESWKKDFFPFVKLEYNPVMVGWFGQGLLEILMPTQMELYRTLIVTSQSIELACVPRVLVEEMSKILETSFNNRIGSIIKYRNTPPQFVNMTAQSPEMYNYIQWLIQNAYQMAGISGLSAGGLKPQGLNSGEAIRSYDQIQSDRFAALEQRYQNAHVDLSYLMLDCAEEIYEETGKYTTVFPSKDGTREVDFRHIKQLNDNYVIQCFVESSLPKDPAGRQARLSEMFAAGEIDRNEFRRLSNFPDLEQSDQLAFALEERILHDLDEIIDKGEKGFSAPDEFILDPTDLATTLTVQTINKYTVTDLEDEKKELLQTYFLKIQDLKQAAMPQQPMMAPEASGLPIVPPQPSVAPTSGVQV